VLFEAAGLALTAAGETEILEKLCLRLVDSGLFLAATIGQVNAQNIWTQRGAAARGGSTVRPAAARRQLNAPMPPLNLLAWTEKKTLVANHYAADPRFQARRGEAARLGIGAVAAFIIRRRRERWAVLSVTAGGQGFFDDELVQSLERLAGLVGHALNELDMKWALRAAREAQHLIDRRDPVTGLPNRLGFTERLNQALSHGKRADASITVIRLDLDDFRFVNERFGRASGDFLLTTIAGRLTGGLTAPHFAGRMGGDEFAILLEGRGEWHRTLRPFLERLNGSLCQPVTLPNGEIVQPVLHAGVSAFPSDHADADQLLRHAEMALFAAKADRRTSPFWRLYRGIMSGGNEPRFANALLKQGALRVVYQPVVELFSGKIVSVEALARLQDGSALLKPAQFLHDMLAADRMILFRQVVEISIRQLQDWDASGFSVSVSVNIDAQILLLDGTIAFLRSILAETGLDPARLCLELLETHNFPDLRLARAQIEAVRALGLRAALDDLGAGYSSILKIRELPLDTVKLDRAFVAGLRQRPDDLLFVAVFQTLTAARGMTLIVEGVETEDVLDALNMMGVRYAQGFKLAEPMAPDALRCWLDEQRFSQTRAPRTLLGAYAVHLAWLRAFSSSRSRGALLAYLRDEESVSLDAFFHQHDLIGTSLHDAYEYFQTVMHEEASEIASIAEAAARFRAMLMAALKAER
jgi:diguanylate cyclase (GGDEF)-like protein